ncbi:hypothetical protein L7F22_029056 [Adiantum nelumboides]|nr:hypothetical protein [Adiantum nelumboides]
MGRLSPLGTALLFLTLSSQIFIFANAATTVGFYTSSCSRAEAIIKERVQARFTSDPTITAGLLRLFFHDCFVSGCDASLLLDSTPDSKSEKDAGPNLSVRGYDLIDDIKTALEAACPGIVSCSDIVAYATRDSVALAGGPDYPVGGGRLDSLTSRMTDANSLPSPTFSVEQARQSFSLQGLSLNDMVTLLGAHSVGFSHCGFFSDRVFNFRGTGQPDPSMNPTLVSKLSNVCPNPPNGVDPAVALDQGTRDAFDSSYYTKLTEGFGILQLDQEMSSDPSTSAMVSQFTNQASFFSAFVQSITTLGDLNIKQSPSEGQVRLQCRRVNPPGTPPPVPVPVTPPPTTPQPQTPTTPLPPPVKTPTTPPLPPTPKPPVPKPTPPTPKPLPPTPKPPVPRPTPPTPKPLPPTPKPLPPAPKPKPRPPIRRPLPRPRPLPVPLPRPIFPPRKSPKPRRPSKKPTRKPTRKPTGKPTRKPIKKPTKKPIRKPAKKPIKKPVRRF